MFTKRNVNKLAWSIFKVLFWEVVFGGTATVVIWGLSLAFGG